MSIFDLSKDIQVLITSPLTLQHSPSPVHPSLGGGVESTTADYYTVLRNVSGQNIKKTSLSDSASDIMELEEGILLAGPEHCRKMNNNLRHNNINIVSIETDVWLLGKLEHCCQT